MMMSVPLVLGVPKIRNHGPSTVMAVFILLSFLPNVQASWLNLGLPHAYQAITEEMMEGNNQTQSNLEFLEPNQKKLYDHDIGTLYAISKGAYMTIQGCQGQFKQRRWNCPVYNKTNIFGQVLNHKTRETAFIYAIQSAGLTHSVTKACARGELKKCGCDPSPRDPTQPGRRNDITWGGCFDDVGFGSRFSKKFLDSLERQNTSDGSMNIWNYGVGRKVLKDNMVVKCRCYGPTGGCSFKTCWKKLQSFQKTGSILKQKFEEARVVRWNKDTRMFNRINNNHIQPTKRDFVYLERSPSYCEFDPEFGSPGTKGRQCNKTSMGIDGCMLMCCGRGHRDVVDTDVERCNCQFQWCCRLTCMRCVKRVKRSLCN